MEKKIRTCTLHFLDLEKVFDLCLGILYEGTLRKLGIEEWLVYRETGTRVRINWTFMD